MIILSGDTTTPAVVSLEAIITGHVKARCGAARARRDGASVDIVGGRRSNDSLPRAFTERRTVFAVRPQCDVVSGYRSSTPCHPEPSKQCPQSSNHRASVGVAPRGLWRHEHDKLGCQIASCRPETRVTNFSLK